MKVSKVEWEPPRWREALAFTLAPNRGLSRARKDTGWGPFSMVNRCAAPASTTVQSV